MCMRGQRTVMKKLKNGCSRPVCVGKPIIKPPVRCPKYMVMCKRGQRKVMKKLKNGCSRPVCVGKPIKPCPVYKIRCKRGQRTVMKKLKNGCSRPVCVDIPVKKCCRKFGRRKICSRRYCKKRCPKYRLRPCKGGSVRSWIKLKNGCKIPRCKSIRKRCCRKFGRRKICSTGYCKKQCPVYRPIPCKDGQRMVKKNMINGCSRPVCVDLYHLAPKGATNCESGNPITIKYCDKAVAILARRNNKTPGRALQTGSGGKCGDGGWGSVPRGCSAQTGGDWAAHLKTSGINCNNGGYQLVCTGPGKQVIKPPVRCPKYIVKRIEQAAKRAQRLKEQAAKTKNAAARRFEQAGKRKAAKRKEQLAKRAAKLAALRKRKEQLRKANVEQNAKRAAKREQSLKRKAGKRIEQATKFGKKKKEQAVKNAKKLREQIAKKRREQAAKRPR